MKKEKMISLVIIALIIALVLTTLLINQKKAFSNSIDISSVNDIVNEMKNTSDDFKDTIENDIDEYNITRENIVVDNNINTTEETNIIKQEIAQKETPKQTMIDIQEKKTESLKQTEQTNTISVPKQESTPKQEIQVQEQPKEEMRQEETTKQEQPKEEIRQEETKQEQPKEEIKKCTDVKHGIGVGNSNKWFDSKQEAIVYYDNIIKTLGNKWTNYEIDSETYYKNCPDGYEVFSCPYCGKWTINLFY